MQAYDEAFVKRFMTPWNAHDVNGAMALITEDCLWEIPRGSEPPADGSKAKFHACDVMTVRDGKCAAKRSYRKAVG